MSRPFPALPEATASPALIYPAQPVMTLLSRAWNLVRLNLKASLLIVLPPTLLATVFHLLFSLLSSQNVLTRTPAAQLNAILITAIASLVVAVPSFFLYVLGSGALSRLYYSAIVGETPLGVKACWRHMSRIWLPVCGVSVALTVALLAFIVADIVIFYLGLLLAAVTLGAFTVMMASSPNYLLGVMMILFLLALGFTVLSVTIAAVSLQSFCFVFPLLALATASHSRPPVLSTLTSAYRLLFAHLPRVIIFSVLLFLFSLVLMGVLMSPAWVWAALEMGRLGLNQQPSIPLHVQTVLNLWNSLANLLVLPFHLSAMTLFWYDVQVRREGLDLRLWLNRLFLRRHREGEPPFAILPRP